VREDMRDATIHRAHGLQAISAADTRPEPLELPVLVVNRSFVPVHITSVRRAFLLLFRGSALVIDARGDLFDFPSWQALEVSDDDDAIPIIGGVLRAPRVLHVRRYERVRRPSLRLTRRNVMLRDAHQCQYCTTRPPLRELNIDHVMPRSRGGSDTWENLVTACRRCNLTKSSRTPEEANMRLIRQPSTPRWSMTTQLLMNSARTFEEWAPYLEAA